MSTDYTDKKLLFVLFFRSELICVNLRLSFGANGQCPRHPPSLRRANSESDRGQARGGRAQSCGDGLPSHLILANNGNVPAWDSLCAWRSYIQDERNQTQS